MNAGRWVLPLALFAGIVFAAAPVGAHKPSDAYLVLERNDTALSGQWDIALRDLDAALGLDGDGNGELTWGELKARRLAIEAYALARLTVAAGGAPCTLGVGELSVDRHSDGAYAVLGLRGTCPQGGRTLDVDYRLFADLDPQHRGLVSAAVDGRHESAALGGERHALSFGTVAGGSWAQFAAYFGEGTHHIWQGIDHLLFLLSLLLPAVLVRRAGRWEAAASFRGTVVDVAKVVTAFTLAHSLTLTLAVLGVVSLPSRLVESAIALSVVLAALNNLRPVVAGGRWIAAFGFGLLHGFGFAGALQELGLPSASLALSLAGFNAGVEVGQLAIVAAFLPLAYAFRGRRGYARYVLGGGSAAIASLAVAWFVERAFDVPLLPVLALGG
jgi:hypothetical protein